MVSIMWDPTAQWPRPQSQATQIISYLTFASAPVTPPHQTLVVFILLGQVVIKNTLGYCLWDREKTLRSTQGEKIQNSSQASKARVQILVPPMTSWVTLANLSLCVMTTLIKLLTSVTLNEKHTGQSPAWRDGRELWVINIGPVLAAVTGLASQQLSYHEGFRHIQLHKPSLCHTWPCAYSPTPGVQNNLPQNFGIRDKKQNWMCVVAVVPEISIPISRQRP